MGNLFGVRRRAPQVTAQDRAILQLKQQRDKIKIYQKKTEADLEKNKDLAIKLYQKGMIDRALIVLRRKKYMEEILNRTDKQLETLEQLVADIEYTQIEVSVVEGLKVGTEALKQLNNLMNIDDIQQMMEDNAEAAEKQREISQILRQSTERYDDDDLTKELENIIEAQKQPVKHREEEKDIVTELPSPPEKLPVEQAVEQAPESENVESSLDNLPDVPENSPAEKVETKSRETRHLEPAQ